MDLDVVIITNSPGELSSWVRVTVERVRARAPGARIVVMLVPCPYASGREAEIAHSFGEVDMVLSPGEFLLHLAGLPGGERYRPAPEGVVVFLGGDYWHALLMARKLRYPAVAYTDRASSWGRFFDRLCVTSGRQKKDIAGAGVPAEKIEVVGNLMVEGVRPRLERHDAFPAWGLDADRPTVGLFPGSRLYHVQASLSVFLSVAEDIAREQPDVQFALGLSPFLTVEDLEGCLEAQPWPYLRGSRGDLVREGGILRVVTEEGVRIPIIQRQQHDLMNQADLLLTIPGTNTAEIACLGKPMVVAMTWRARIPRGGPGAILGLLPMGSGLRRRLLRGILTRIRFTALPNQIARREVVPEVRAEHEAVEISRVVLDLLQNEARRAEMGKELRALMGGTGAADRLAEIVLSTARQKECVAS